MSKKYKFGDNDKVFNGTDTPCPKPRCISAPALSDATGHVTIYDGKGACGHDCYFPDSDKIKQQNTAIQAWNAAHPDEKQKPMVQVTGVSIWIAK